jgi:hypothetical protein
LAAPTQSSNPAATAALAAGLLAVAALPAAVALAQVSSRVKLVQAAAGAPVAAVLGAAAIVLARRAHRRAERTLGRTGGLGVARAGRILGVLGLCLAASAAIAIGFYGLLVHYQ